MNTRIVMIASALVLGLLGLIASFLPHEVLAYAGEVSTGLLPFLVQIIGALYLGFAMMNWTASCAEQVAMALGKGAVALSFTTPLVLAAILYAIFAIAFAIVFFTSPVKRTDATPAA